MMRAAQVGIDPLGGEGMRPRTRAIIIICFPQAISIMAQKQEATVGER